MEEEDITMGDLHQPAETALAELRRKMEEKFKAGTADADHFMTMAEIEQLWGDLLNETKVLFADMFQSMAQTTEERDSPVQKKRIRPTEIPPENKPQSIRDIPCSAAELYTKERFLCRKCRTGGQTAEYREQARCAAGRRTWCFEHTV